MENRQGFTEVLTSRPLSLSEDINESFEENTPPLRRASSAGFEDFDFKPTRSFSGQSIDLNSEFVSGRLASRNDEENADGFKLRRTVSLDEVDLENVPSSSNSLRFFDLRPKRKNKHPLKGRLRSALLGPSCRRKENERPTEQAETENSKDESIVVPLAKSFSCTSLEDEETCFICLAEFENEDDIVDDGEKRIIVPCSKNCNNAPVHNKCIYEWRQRKEVGDGKHTGTCPLCREPLKENVFTPMDMLHSATFVMFSERKSFVSRPLSASHDSLRCYIRVIYLDGILGNLTSSFFMEFPVKYEFYLQAPPTLPYPLGPLPGSQSPQHGDQLLLTCKKRLGNFGAARLDMSLDRNGEDFDIQSPNHVATVASSFSGLEHTIVAPYVNGSFRELGCVVYQQNRLGLGIGPRKMRVCVPKVENCLQHVSNLDGHVPTAQQPTSVQTAVYRPGTNAEKMANLLRSDVESVKNNPKLLYYENREPRWLEAIQAYSLDFQGRVTLPSNKNFQLVTPSANADSYHSTNEKEVLQFGKVVDRRPVEVYTLDMKYPLSPIQAFGIAISACDHKLACA